MATKKTKAQYKGSGANPIKETIESVAGYPDKLKIFKVECSPHYWARVYINGKYKIKSLKTDVRKDALTHAKTFYEDALVDTRLGTVKPTKSKSFAVIGNTYIETLNGSGKRRRYLDDRARFKKELIPHFGEQDVSQITNADIGALFKKLEAKKLSPATINHYAIVLRKILNYAADNRIINSVPNFPRIHGKSTSVTKRDYFDLNEINELKKAVTLLAREKATVRGNPITLELKYIILFMVNSFIRPSDLRVLRHSHIVVKDRPDEASPLYQHYLLLTHPATKTTDQEVVTMPAAYRYYQKLLALQKKRGYGEGHQFLAYPEYPNRTTMMNVLSRLFRAVVNRAGIVSEGEKHTLYSLRHSSIMLRLLYGEVNTLQLARNARTSQAMIEKHYASRLTNLMGVDELHSFKAKPKKKTPETTKVPEAQDVVDVPVKKVTAKKIAPAKRVKASQPR